MPLDPRKLLLGLFGEASEEESACRKVAEACDKMAAASLALRQELSGALDRLSASVGDCLQEQLLHVEWEKRARDALVSDPKDSKGLANLAARRSAEHRKRAAECREACAQEDEVVGAFERRLLELDERLQRLARERELLRATDGLARGRQRVAEALEELRAATGLDFLDALDTVQLKARRELILAQAAEDVEPDKPRE